MVSQPPAADQPVVTSTGSKCLDYDTRTYYAGLSDAELSGAWNRLTHELADCDQFDTSSAEVCRILVGDHLSVVEGVQRRRARRFRAGSGPNPNDTFTQDWSASADEVRQRADILQLFRAAYYPLEQRGQEWSGPCFACGGTDRMVIFPEVDDRHDHPRAWCRQCGGYWDAIGCYRNLSGPARTVGYYDAVNELARVFNVLVPPPMQQQHVKRAKRAGFVEIVGGKVVSR